MYIGNRKLLIMLLTLVLMCMLSTIAAAFPEPGPPPTTNIGSPLLYVVTGMVAIGVCFLRKK